MGFKVQHGFDDLRGEGGFVREITGSKFFFHTYFFGLDLQLDIEKSIVNIWSHSLF